MFPRKCKQESLPLITPTKQKIKNNEQQKSNLLPFFHEKYK
jgi:hypothetical protein